MAWSGSELGENESGLDPRPCKGEVMRKWGLSWRRIRDGQSKGGEEERSAKRNAELLTALRECPDSIIATDAEGLVTMYNAGAQELFGDRPAEIMGQKATRFYPTLEIAKGIKRAMRADPKGRVKNMEAVSYTHLRAHETRHELV